MKTQLQSGSKNRQFSKDRPFTSRGLFDWKSVFLTGRVLQIVGMFLQNWPIRWFHLSKDALTVAPKNRVRGTSTRWQNFEKSVRRRRRTDGRTFLSVAHTKCPSGNDRLSTFRHCYTLVIVKKRRRRKFLAFWNVLRTIYLRKWSFPKANHNKNPPNFLDPDLRSDQNKGGF